MRVSNTAIGALAIAFGIWTILYSRDFPKMDQGYPGPALFPVVLAVLFILSGIVLISQDIRSRSRILKFDISDFSRAHLVNIGLVLAAILFYIFFTDFLGFQFTSVIILVALMKRLRVSTFWSFTMACGVTFGIYVLFSKILLVPLPWGLWGW